MSAPLPARLQALGAELAHYQDAAALSAGELGQRAGLSGRQVRRVRRGADHHVSTLLALCDALALELILYQPRDRARLLQLGVPLERLGAVSAEAVARLLRALGKLSKRERAAVRRLPAILGRLTAEERRALLGF